MQWRCPRGPYRGSAPWNEPDLPAPNPSPRQGSWPLNRAELIHPMQTPLTSWQTRLPGRVAASDDNIKGSTSLCLHLHLHLSPAWDLDDLGGGGREGEGRAQERVLSDLGAWKKFHAFIVTQSNAQALGTSAQATCAGFKVEEAGSCPRTTDNPVRETLCSMTESGQNAIRDAEKCPPLVSHSALIPRICVGHSR